MTLALLSMLLGTIAAVGQAPTKPQPLPPGQTLEREMTGAQTHRYRLQLEKGEFLQVRAEQKGVDVTLRLLSEGGAVVATMDSPNGKEGPETLSFVVAQAGVYTLEVGGFDEAAEKGTYFIRREAARAATAQDRRRVEVERVFVEGMMARSKEGQQEVAVKKLKEALAGWEELKDDYLKELTAQQFKQAVPLPPESAAVFQQLGNDLATGQKTLSEAQVLMTKSKADSLAAREKAEAALSVFRSLSAKASDAATVEKIRSSGETAEELLKSLKQFQLFAKIGIGVSLNVISQTHFNLGEWQKYIEYLSQAAAVYEEITSDKNFTATPELRKQALAIRPLGAGTFVQIAQSLDQRLGQTEAAVGYMIRGLEAYRALYEESRDPQYRREEAMVLVNLGMIYGKMSKDKKKAVESISAGVDIYRTLPDRQGDVAGGLLQMANYQFLDLDYQAALDSANRGLEIYRALDDRQGQSSALHYLGMIYYTLGDQPKVREHFARVISLLESPGFNENYKQKRYAFVNTGIWHEKIDAFIEERRLVTIASAYRFLEEYQKAKEYYEKALPLARASAEPNSIRLTLASIGYCHAKLGEGGKGVEFYRQALEISRAGAEQETIADDLTDLGWVLLEAGRPEEALKYQNEAMLLYRAVGVGRDGAFTISLSSLLNELGRSHYALGDRRLAIFYGKQGVNAIQNERQRLQSLDAASQKGFLEKKEKHYRRLADWLIEEGRLPEAEQVLEMLKEEEFFQFVRRNDKVASALLRRVEPNSAEEVYLKRYDEIADQLTRLGAEAAALEAESKHSPPDQPFPKQARLDEVEGLLKAGRETFRLFLKELEAEFGKENVRVQQVESGLQKDLKRWNAKGVVVISTITGKDRLNLIVTTADTQRAHTIDIPEAKLNQLIGEFRRAVRNGCACVDPRPSGQQLYNLLVKAIEGDLKGAGAKTLLWSLDGALRYVPVAALYDKEKGYLAERFANVVITLASRTTLEHQPAARASWQALGLGVSKSFENFLALDAVPEELRGIIREQPTESGVVPGKRLQDEQFNYAAFRRHMGRYPMVHIASHFSLRGKDTESFLLLGGGEQRKLTIADLRGEGTIFDGVELLTLSACDTATGNTGLNGEEIESFGMIAQEQGAMAVMATLWPVADPSTRDLMVEFYRRLKADPRLTKAAALQLAQRSMIDGRLSPAAGGGSGSGRGSELAGAARADNEQPKFPSDRSSPYAHPYYWAPFVLIGNWR